MRTPRLPAAEWNNTPADINGLVRFAGKPNLVSARVPSRSVSALKHVRNVMAHAQKADLVFQRNGRIHLNWRDGQFSRLLAAEVCASAVVMLDTQCSEVVWRVLATLSTRMFPLHFPYRASPCAIRFQLNFTFRSICAVTSFFFLGGGGGGGGWFPDVLSRCVAQVNKSDFEMVSVGPVVTDNNFCFDVSRTLYFWDLGVLTL